MKINSTNVINKLIELEDSTTSFLEILTGELLKVKVESQSYFKDGDTKIIKRVVRLYFDSSDHPVLFGISHLNQKQLSTLEYKSIMEGKLPIGKVFKLFNNEDLIKKKNILISKELNQELASSLNVSSPAIFKKKYDYWVGNREIGTICEFFNEESLLRYELYKA